MNVCAKHTLSLISFSVKLITSKMGKRESISKARLAFYFVKVHL